MDPHDQMDEIEQATRDVLETVHAVANRVLPPENARAVLLGIAAVMIEKNPGNDGAEPNARTVNATWAAANFPWRMVRLTS